MAQPSIVRFFNSRKRPACDDFRHDKAQKILKVEEDASNLKIKHIQHLKPALKAEKVLNDKPQCDVDERCVTPPPKSEPTENSKELEKIKKTISKSAKLSQLKESIGRFRKLEEQLQTLKKKTAESPKLKTCKAIEFEVTVSPHKVQSPEKLYLSPKKDIPARRNLFNVSSPTKTSSDLNSLTQISETLTKPGLALPYKYRSLSEIFRALDTVVQILHNRKELITFSKLKPAIEEMLKRSFLQKHLAQIKKIYPKAYDYSQEKVKIFGGGFGQTKWELVVTPKIDTENMTTQVLLDRRRFLYKILIDKVKSYHNEFLSTLIPPLNLNNDEITRWHPDFDLEKVPDVEVAELPEAPVQEFHSGKEVLECARKLFNCNTRMNKALQNLQELKARREVPEEAANQPPTLLKGIPQSLLEKVRQRQAAKALISMTRSPGKESQVMMYARLPELARLIRGLFVSEKKSVLELNVLLEKIGNSYRGHLTKSELEGHIRAIAKEVPKWIVFHNLRNSEFLKLDKNADLSLVIKKLQDLAIEKRDH